MNCTLGTQNQILLIKIVGSIIENWYYDIDKPVVIDKNRAWCARVPFIEGYIQTRSKDNCSSSKS